MEKIIHEIEFVGSNLHELQAALTAIGARARFAHYANKHNGAGASWGGSSTIDMEDKNGEEIAKLQLVERNTDRQEHRV